MIRCSYEKDFMSIEQHKLAHILLFVNPLSANPKNGQIDSNNCLSAFDDFMGLALKGLSYILLIN